MPLGQDHALVPGADILGVCNVKKDTTEVRYFVILGEAKHEPERDLLGHQVNLNPLYTLPF